MRRGHEIKRGWLHRVVFPKRVLLNQRITYGLKSDNPENSRVLPVSEVTIPGSSLMRIVIEHVTLSKGNGVRHQVSTYIVRS